jgi:hypothetical protein
VDRTDWMQRYREEAAERRRLEAGAQETAEVCGKCGTTLDGEIYRVSVYGQFQPMCRDCAPRWMVNRYGKPARVIPRQDVYEWPCASCGRPVVFSMSDRQYRQRVYCSNRCRRTYRREETEPHQKTCAVCGTGFTAKRSDAKTCSAKCRQRLHRGHT